MIRARGTTLVELMITVALLGIMTMTGGALVMQNRRAALDELARERAAQLLEYEADCLSTGKPTDAAVVAALEQALPRAKVSVTRSGRTATIAVEWLTRVGPATRSLTVFTKGGP